MILQSQYPDYTLPRQNAVTWILQSLDIHGENIAFIDPLNGEKITFARVKRDVLAYKKVLKDAGFVPNSVVGVLLPFQWECCSLILAIAAYGGVSTFFHVRETEDLIIKRLNSLNAKFFIAFDKTISLEKIRKTVPSIQYSTVLSHIAEQMKNVKITQTEAAKAKPSEDITSYDTPMFIFSSSGTTGEAKGIVRTQKGFMSIVLSNLPCFGAKKGEVAIISIARIHAGAVTYSSVSFILGVTQILTPEPTYKIVKSLIETHKVSMFFTPNAPLYMECINNLGNQTSLKKVMFGGSPFPSNLQEKLEANTGAVAFCIYGATECGTVTVRTTTLPSDSVGKLLPMQKLKILNISDGKNILRPNESGEICIFGPAISPGYLNNKKPLADEFGWYHTGDYGYFDEGGNVYIVDRIVDLIKGRDGVAIFPSKLESELLKHPLIKDAAVVGVFQVINIETPKAYVVRSNESLSKEEVIKFFNDKVEAYQQLNGGVEFVTEIPRAGIGKILRRHLKEMQDTLSN